MTDGGADFAEVFPSAKDVLAPAVSFPTLLAPVVHPVCVYTDGSATSGVGRCASSVFIRFGSEERELSEYVGVGSILMAELFAMRMALRHLLSFFPPSACPPVLLFSDSQVAIDLVKGNADPSGLFSLVSDVRALFTRLLCRTFVSLDYIPAHRSFYGNDRADLLAKAALKAAPRSTAPVIGQPPIPLSVAKALCKRAFRSRWQENWLAYVAQSAGVENFTRLKLTVGPFAVAFLGSRLAQVLLARLRLGVCKLALSTSIRSGVSPMCACGTGMESVSHFLLRCPLHAPHRVVMFRAVRTVFQGIITEEVLLGVVPGLCSRGRMVIVNAVYAFVIATRRRI